MTTSRSGCPRSTTAPSTRPRRRARRCQTGRLTRWTARTRRRRPRGSPRCASSWSRVQPTPSSRRSTTRSPACTWPPRRSRGRWASSMRSSARPACPPRCARAWPITTSSSATCSSTTSPRAPPTARRPPTDCRRSRAPTAPRRASCYRSTRAPPARRRCQTSGRAHGHPRSTPPPTRPLRPPRSSARCSRTRTWSRCASWWRVRSLSSRSATCSSAWCRSARRSRPAARASRT
mmetsp:Transcript_8550/g.21254  ORF Transcript_8550/g.21254 Transcript_8550/m.21254 type:complete len:234 (-) Transcript_8550:292-993(-)